MSFNYLAPSQTDADWHPFKADLAKRNAVILDERSPYRLVLEQAKFIHQQGVPFLQSDQYYQKHVLPLKQQYIKIRRDYLQTFQPVAATPEPVEPADERDRQRLITEELTRNEQMERQEAQKLAQLDHKNEALEKQAEAIQDVSVNKSFNDQVGLQTFTNPPPAPSEGAGAMTEPASKSASGKRSNTWLEHVKKVKAEHPRQEGEAFKHYLKRVMPIAKKSYVRSTEPRPKRARKVTIVEPTSMGGVLIDGQDPENPSDEKIMDKIRTLYDLSYQPEVTTTTETAITPNPYVIDDQKSAQLLTEQVPPSPLGEQSSLKTEAETQEDELLEGGAYRVPTKSVTWPQFLQHIRRQVKREERENGRQYLSRVMKIASQEYKRYRAKRSGMSAGPIEPAKAADQTKAEISTTVTPSHKDRDQIAEIKDTQAHQERDKHQSKVSEIADIELAKKTTGAQSQLINNKLQTVAKIEKKARQRRIQRQTPQIRQKHLSMLLRDINLSEDEKLKMIREVIATNVQQSAYRDSEALLERLLKENPNIFGDVSIGDLKKQDLERRQKEEASKNIEFKVRLINEFPELLDTVKERFPGLTKEGIINELYKLSIEEIEELVKPSKERQAKIKLINKNPSVVNQYTEGNPSEAVKSNDEIYQQLLDLDLDTLRGLIHDAKEARRRASSELSKDIKKIGQNLLTTNTRLRELITFQPPPGTTTTTPTPKEEEEEEEEEEESPTSLRFGPSAFKKRTKEISKEGIEGPPPSGAPSSLTTSTGQSEDTPTAREIMKGNLRDAKNELMNQINALQPKTTGTTKARLTTIHKALGGFNHRITNADRLEKLQEIQKELTTLIERFNKILEVIKVETPEALTPTSPIKATRVVPPHLRGIIKLPSKSKIEIKETPKEAPKEAPKEGPKEEGQGYGYPVAKTISAKELSSRKVKLPSKRKPKL